MRPPAQAKGLRRGPTAPKEVLRLLAERGFAARPRAAPEPPDIWWMATVEGVTPQA